MVDEGQVAPAIAELGDDVAAKPQGTLILEVPAQIEHQQDGPGAGDSGGGVVERRGGMLGLRQRLVVRQQALANPANDRPDPQFAAAVHGRGSDQAKSVLFLLGHHRDAGILGLQQALQSFQIGHDPPA